MVASRCVCRRFTVVEKEEYATMQLVQSRLGTEEVTASFQSPENAEKKKVIQTTSRVADRFMAEKKDGIHAEVADLEALPDTPLDLKTCQAAHNTHWLGKSGSHGQPQRATHLLGRCRGGAAKDRCRTEMCDPKGSADTNTNTEWAQMKPTPTVTWACSGLVASAMETISIRSFFLISWFGRHKCCALCRRV